MKKTKKILYIIIFTLLFIILIIICWNFLWSRTKEPSYPNFYGTTSRTAYANTILSLEEAIVDLDWYISEIKSYHPQPFLFLSEEAFNKKVSEIKDDFKKEGELTVQVFFMRLYELAGMINDSHTWIFPPQNNNVHYLPFSVIYRNGMFYNTAKNFDLPYMANIISINGIQSNELYNILARYAVTSLNGGVDRFVENEFQTHIPLVMGYPEKYIIKYLLNDEVHTRFIRPVLSYRAENKKQVTYYEYEFKEVEIPVLEINSFDSFNDLDFFEKKIDDFFIEYKDSESIVIDLRQNGGGSGELGIYVYNYFADDTYTLTDDFIIPINKRVKAYYEYFYHRQLYKDRIPSVFWNLPLFYFNPDMDVIAKVLTSKNGGTINIGEYITYNPIKKEDRYKGKVYLLIGGNTGSAAIDMASVFKYNYKNGVIIGQETKHPKSFSGNISKYYLPFSAIGYTIPHTYTIAPGDKDLKRGVIPDYEIEHEIDDYVEGSDPELEFIASELL